jgi:large subunit ribosomal protein L23
MKTPQDIVLRPIVSEKSYDGMKDKIYQFKVARDANKDQVKDAVEKLFKVRVLKVNTINVHGREKRRGVHRGMTAAWKKAVVRIHPEDSIAFFEGTV